MAFFGFDNQAHYKLLFERHLADSTRYQAQLFHAWRVIRQQQKGLNRLNRKIKSLQQKLENRDRIQP